MSEEKALEILNAFIPNSLLETLDIVFDKADVENGLFSASMPVTQKVFQPMGILHGGVTVALCETLGSAASMLYVDPKKEMTVGTEISANHLKTVKEGRISAKGKLVHKGRKLHFWTFEVVDNHNRLIASGKMSNMVIERK